MASLYDGATGLRTRIIDDDIDPMASIANISDAMLVFACGLIIALVVAWNVDLSSVTQVEIDDTQQIENVEALEGLLDENGNSYIQRGIVYQDPVTGKLYMQEMSDEPAAEPAAEAGSPPAAGGADG